MTILPNGLSNIPYIEKDVVLSMQHADSQIGNVRLLTLFGYWKRDLGENIDKTMS